MPAQDTRWGNESRGTRREAKAKRFGILCDHDWIADAIVHKVSINDKILAPRSKGEKRI